MIVKTNTKLYRADFSEPMMTWNTFSKNPLPQFNSNVLGHKNQHDLFFLTDSLLTANHYGVKGSLDLNALIARKPEFYLTKLEEEIEVTIIDFSLCERLYQMLDLLYSLDIDVLTSDFKVFTKDSVEGSFEDYKEVYMSINHESDLNEIEQVNKSLLGMLGGGKNLEINPKLEVPIFGQRLSDFSNGLAFKNLVASKFPEVDGYKWREGAEGFTIGLFNSQKLDKCPKTVSLVDTWDYMAKNNLIG